ncbi:hypothetical protein HRI_000618800 [Hibiscus trionum]|uniref:3'-5' exonuclease domain-containing protein n=1 Tax=Hibiscus trionum TaxID=183268 RepID=A0A9W7H1S3_HIBTR|nr:hypothetical protein HRI_000618800 [Hibiscus trionum]
MEITVEKTEILVEKMGKMKKEEDPYYFYDCYTVNVEGHRILTIVTYCDYTAAKWLKEAKKINNTTSLRNSLIVGFSVERRYDEFTRRGRRDTPYELLYLCTGSQCLIYHLEDPDSYYISRPHKFLNPFFEDPNVIVVGTGIKAKAASLERHFAVKIKNAVDLNELAVKGMKRDELDLGRYDLDRLAKAVLGKRMDVVRPEEKLEWFKERRSYWHDDEMTESKVMFTTTDAYLFYRIGSKLLSMIHGHEKDSSAAAAAVAAAAAAPSNKKKKKKNKKKNKKGKK